MRFVPITRVPAKYAILFASALFLVQLLLRTDITFCYLTALYILLSTVAFNTAGGLVYPSGAYIFFTATLTALVGIVYKAFIGEAGQTDLASPTLTMLVYCGAMAGMGVVAFLTAKFRRKRPFLAGMVTSSNMMRSAVGCLMIGLSLQLFGFMLPVRVFTALAQLNQFYPIAIILGVFHEIKSSDGNRSTNWVVWTAGVMIFIGGLIGFSKQGLFLPVLAWLLPCMYLGYRFKPLQLASVVFGIFLMFHYLVPYSQYARNFREDDSTLTDNVRIAVKYLSDLPATRRKYLEDVVGSEDAYIQGPHYFDNPQGFFDRLEMLAWDDALIDYTDQTKEIGLAPTYLSYANLIPRVFYPDKPTINFGNVYAREMGLISLDDTTTGISFSPSADAFHQRKWFGVFVVLPIILFMLFLVMDSLTGDVRDAPWGILPIATIAHIAPEGALGYSITLTVYGAIALLLVALVVRYLVPIVSDLFFKRVMEQATLRQFPTATQQPKVIGPLVPIRRAPRR